MATQREEVVIQLGVDNSRIASGLATAREKFSEFTSHIKRSFKDAFHLFLTPLSLGGAIIAFKNLTDYASRLKSISESIGLDTGITQDLLNLGKAAGISEGSIEKMMQVFVSKLSSGQNPSEALNAIADKMASIHDPAERAKIAIDAFGNSGVKLIPVLSQGSEGLKTLAEDFGKLTDSEIESVDHTDMILQKFNSKLKVYLAERIEAVGAAIDTIKKLMEENSKGHYPTIGQAYDEVVQDDMDAEARTHILKAKLKAQDDRRRKAKESQDLISDGLKAQAELQDHLRKIEYGRADIAKKIFMNTEDLLEARRKLDLMDSKTPEKDRVKAIENIADLENAIYNLKLQSKAITDAEDKSHADMLKKLADMRSRMNKEFLPTLDQLIAVRGPYSRDAAQLKWLQNDVPWSLARGNKGRAKQEDDRIQSIRDKLSAAGVYDDPNKAIIDAINKAIEGQTTALQKNGLKIIVPEP